VLFALVLFLVAVGQRFQTRGVRIGSNAIAMGLLSCQGSTSTTSPTGADGT
jgi:hypothetical protein